MKVYIFSSLILALWLYFSDAILLCSHCGEADTLISQICSIFFSYRPQFRYYFPAYSYYQFFFLLKLDQLCLWQPTICLAFLQDCSALNLLASKSLRPSSSYCGSIIFVGIFITCYTESLWMCPQTSTPGIPSTHIARYCTVLLSALLICVYKSSFMGLIFCSRLNSGAS